MKGKDYDYEDEPEIKLVDIIEDEFEHLSSEYGDMFKKFSVDEFQEYFAKEYPTVVCIKKREEYGK